MTERFFRAVCFTLLMSVSALTQAETALSTPLTASLSISGNMSTEKFSQLLKHGFKSVIVNRPDSETGNQVTVHQLRSLAEQKQVSVIYQPVESGKISATDVTEFARYYNELPKPILMICKTGTRSSNLYHQAKTAGLLNE